MGKSTLALALAMAQGERRVYVATMRPMDREDDARVERHRAERAGCGFETVERGDHITGLIGALGRDTSLLLDSATALLANEMFAPDGRVDPEAGGRVAEDLLRVLSTFENAVVVSDAIYSDARRFGAATEAYRRALAHVDRAVAERADGVIEMVMGQRVLHKGGADVHALLDAAERALPGIKAR